MWLRSQLAGLGSSVPALPSRPSNGGGLEPRPFSLEAGPTKGGAGCCVGLLLACPISPCECQEHPGQTSSAEGGPSPDAGQNPKSAGPRGQGLPVSEGSTHSPVPVTDSAQASSQAGEQGRRVAHSSPHVYGAPCHRAASWDPQGGQAPAAGATPQGPWERQLRESAPR